VSSSLASVTTSTLSLSPVNYSAASDRSDLLCFLVLTSFDDQ